MKNALKLAFTVPALAYTATSFADIEFSRPLNNPGQGTDFRPDRVLLL